MENERYSEHGEGRPQFIARVVGTRFIASVKKRKDETIMGRIWKLGDNINTDVIIPGRYNVTTDRAQLAKYCLYEVLPEFSQQVRPGDIVMGGHNFGCGS